MLDFSGSDLNLKSAAAQREREAQKAARFADYSAPRGIRAAIAARLARLAIRLDAEAIASIVTPDARVAGHHG